MQIGKRLTVVPVIVCFIASILTTSILADEIKTDAISLWMKADSSVKINPSPQAIAKYLSIAVDKKNIQKLQDEKLASAKTSYVMTLPDGNTVTAYTIRVTKLKNGFVWRGRLEGDGERNSVTLSIVNDVLVGEILRSNGKLFRIRFAGHGLHVIEELASNKFGPGAKPVEVQKRRLPPRKKELGHASLLGEPFVLAQMDRGYFIRTSSNACQDSADRIDVLVVYTPKAKNAAGGENAIQATINLAIDETNWSYENSGILQRVALVGAREVQYTEGLFVTNDLAPLRRKGDHVMDIVHQWRDELYADVVVLITENQNSIPCGGAHQMRSPKHSFEAFAFAAIPRSCATGQYNFAHELGHVMGADHDWAQSNSLFPFEYSHGLTMPHPNDPTVPPWRTIMAENTACSGLPNGCVRVQYWSNPDSLWGDQQMGVNEGPRQADNRKTLNNTASIVANFRRSCSGQ